jgi:DNA-binding NtrC family response regulator
MILEQARDHGTSARALQSTVLVVDDDEHFRNLARQILELDDFDVIEAESVNQCLWLLGCHSVDAIVLDILMPDRDGIEALKDIKTTYSGMKVVTVSGARHSDVYLTTSTYLGADGSLAKSELSTLCALLNTVLKRQS